MTKTTEDTKTDIEPSAPAGRPRMRPCVVVHYHEVGLKGRNRPFFLGTLEKNLRRATAGLGVKEVERASGRILLWLEPDAPWECLRERIARVFGVVNFARGYALQPELETIVQGVLARLPEAGEFATFAVRARRAFKDLPLSSREIAVTLGAAVQDASGAGVNLSAPDMTIYVEVLPQFALFFFGKERGPGGLPVGCSAPVTVLLSGGIDSPVAACRMLKRGSRAVLVHFHSFPYLNSASQEKARELTQVIGGYQGDTLLYLVPLGEIQRQIVVACPAPYRVVLYRRFMVRIAEALGKRHGAQALVTGDSLGQVASQTIENLTAVEDAATQLMLRPLIGMDKQEIADEAERIGTYALSIQPDQDCCALFVPSNPSIHTDLKGIRDAEAVLDVDSLARQGIAEAEVVEYRQENERSNITSKERHAMSAELQE
ncbi:MAG: tRNA 4-thiouridine(8) synthase ThiI [Chloroflexota bacterium]|nr:tRNA 4-thiouridine(8) synthase ThiI [Chloroflexota bacterium]